MAFDKRTERSRLWEWALSGGIVIATRFEGTGGDVALRSVVQIGQIYTFIDRRAVADTAMVDAHMARVREAVSAMRRELSGWVGRAISAANGVGYGVAGNGALWTAAELAEGMGVEAAAALTPPLDLTTLGVFAGGVFMRLASGPVARIALRRAIDRARRSGRYSEARPLSEERLKTITFGQKAQVG